MSPSRCLNVVILLCVSLSIFGCPQQGQDQLANTILVPFDIPSAPRIAVPEFSVPSSEDELPVPENPGSGSDNQTCSPFPCDEPQPYGIWLLEGGMMLPNFVKGLATFNVTTDVKALILNDDGTGRLFIEDRYTGAKDCVRTFAIFDGETLVLDFRAETTTDYNFNLAVEDHTFFFPVVDADEDTLGVADEEGNVALFSRQEELPDDVTCGDIEVLDRFDGLPSPQFFGDLVTYNGDLVYNSGAGQFETFDLDMFEIGLPLAATSSRLVQTTQDGFFWTHCGCGGSRDMFKRTLSSVVDTVDSESEMGGPITFRAAAYDPMTDRLWLHGRPFDSQYGQLFVMNTNGEPDTIEDTISFNRDLRALSFHDGELWGIATLASQVIVNIDRETGKVVDSYELPDEDVSWNGLTFDGDDMYLLGTDLDGEGVIVRLATPMQKSIRTYLKH